VPLRVVIIEDDPDLAQLIAVRIERSFDAKCATFTLGLQGLADLETTPAALVCVDLALPDVSGFEVVARIRQHENGRHMPVLVVSGRTSLDDHARALDVGANAYLEKPMNMKELVQEVKRLLAGGKR
jgi:DNA-binding response OmpR family regulator